jgi:hypothetical protein
MSVVLRACVASLLMPSQERVPMVMVVVGNSELEPLLLQMPNGRRQAGAVQALMQQASTRSGVKHGVQALDLLQLP